MKAEIVRRLKRANPARGSRLPESVSAQGQRVSTTSIEDFRLALHASAGETVSVALESVSSSAEPGSALIEVRAIAASGARLSIPKWPNRSARVGDYRYLETAEPGAIALTVLEVQMPEHALQLELVGHRWKAAIETAIVGSPIVNRSSDKNWIFETPTGARLQQSAAMLDRQLEIPADATTVEVCINNVAVGSPSSGPVRISVQDAAGDELLPLPELQQHPDLGPIVNLRGEIGEHATTLISFSVPRNAVCVRLRGVDWDEKTAQISGEPTLRSTSRSALSIDRFIGGIPHDEQLIVIDTTAPPMGHETLGLRPNNLTHAYARAGRWVVFLPFSSLQDFDHHVGERVVQVPRAEAQDLWVALREHRRGLSDIYICSSFPSFEALAAASDAKRIGWTVVYEVRDDMEEFNRVGYSKWYSSILEQQMLRTADCVASVSRALDEKMATMHPSLGPHQVIPNGVRSSTIVSGAALRTRAVADARSGSTTVGYVGHLTSSWFDWSMLTSVATDMPDVRFEIVGHGMPDDLDLPANVVYLGPKTHDELVAIVEHWKVGLISFRDIPLTRAVDPNKIYEYFAWGLRCVTVEMGSVSEYPWTKVYHDVESFVEHLRSALEAPVADADLAELESFLAGVDWDSRALQMLDFMTEAVA